MKIRFFWFKVIYSAVICRMCCAITFPRVESSFSTKHAKCSPDLEMPCTEDPEYNDVIKERFESLLQSSGLKAAFTNPLLTNIVNDENTQGLEGDHTISSFNLGLDSRGKFSDSRPVCPRHSIKMYPQRAKTKTEDWVFVLNHGKWKQAVNVEQCIRSDESCDLGPNAPNSIQTACRQKYIYRKLLVLDGSGQRIYPESLLMPSCCVCYVRRPSFSPFDRPNAAFSAGNTESESKIVFTLPDIEDSASHMVESTSEFSLRQPEVKSSSQTSFQYFNSPLLWHTRVVRPNALWILYHG